MLRKNRVTQWSCLLLFFAMIPANATVSVAPENALKAAFIFNIVQFVKWSDAVFQGPTDPIKIGIFGKDQFGATLDAMVQDANVQGRTVVIQRSNKLEDLQTCQIIYISPSEAKFLGRVLNLFERQPVLTMSDIDHFAARGGMVGFVKRENRIRFQINLKNVQRANLKISAKVLRLAEIIEGSIMEESSQ